MRPLGTLAMDIRGLGFVVYSPFAMSEVPTGDRFLIQRLNEPQDVAALVRAGRLAGFCTGSPGTYHLELVEGRLDLPAIAGFPWMIRLALEVRDRTVCIRDLTSSSRSSRWQSCRSSRGRVCRSSAMTPATKRRETVP